MPRGRKPVHDPAEVRRLWLELGNQHQVADRLGIHQATVSQILRRQGIQVGKIGRAPTHPLPMGELRQRYEAGESTVDLATAYQVDPEVIRRRMSRAGMTRRNLLESRAHGAKNAQWKGGKSQMQWYRRQSYEVAAICLGQPLAPGWVIHHMDENPENNQPDNLRIFPSQSLHAQYHQRLLRYQRAGLPVDASQLVLEIGGQALPSPPHPILL